MDDGNYNKISWETVASEKTCRAILDKSKAILTWLIFSSLVLYGYTTASFAYLREVKGALNNIQTELETKMDTVRGERDNALELAEQFKKQYNEALFEIAELKELSESETAYTEEWENMGEFKITYYCPCEKCCGKWSDGITAVGTTATEGRTVAVDPKVIPLGSSIRINGKTYIAEDTGVSGRHVDVFMNKHSEALERGTHISRVEIKHN